MAVLFLKPEEGQELDRIPDTRSDAERQQAELELAYPEKPASKEVTAGELGRGDTIVLPDGRNLRINTVDSDARTGVATIRGMLDDGETYRHELRSGSTLARVSNAIEPTYDATGRELTAGMTLQLGPNLTANVGQVVERQTQPGVYLVRGMRSDGEPFAMDLHPTDTIPVQDTLASQKPEPRARQRKLYSADEKAAANRSEETIQASDIGEGDHILSRSGAVLQINRVTMNAGGENSGGSTLYGVDTETGRSVKVTRNKGEEITRVSAPASATSSDRPKQDKHPDIGKDSHIDIYPSGEDEDNLEAMFGVLEHSELVSLAGAPIGSQGEMLDSSPDSVSFGYTNEELGVDAARTISTEHDGTYVAYNDHFYLDKDQQGKGIGAQILSSQVEGYVALGVDRIETMAARSGSMNGYYSWARLGYDAPLSGRITRELQQAMQNGVLPNDGDLDSVVNAQIGPRVHLRHLMKTKAGREWWEEHGHSMSMTFDLSEGSYSRTHLDAYMKARFKESVEQPTGLVPNENVEGYEIPDIFTPDEDAVLDSIFDSYNPMEGDSNAKEATTQDTKHSRTDEQDQG
jgi:GNAT superfamily N-acetyltransferase